MAALTAFQIATLVLGGTGAAVTAYGQRQQGRYAQAAANQNAATAELAAQDALRRGEADEERQRLRVRAILGQQRTAYGASGVEVSGSAIDVLADTAALGELDALTIRNNSTREAWGFRTQGTSYRQQGRMARLQGRYSSYGTVLGGSFDAFADYGKYSGRTTIKRSGGVWV